MISIDRETMMIVAIVVCAAATIFLFRELSKTKDEINDVKGFSSKMMNHLVVQDNMIRQSLRENQTEVEKNTRKIEEIEEVEEKTE